MNTFKERRNAKAKQLKEGRKLGIDSKTLKSWTNGHFGDCPKPTTFDLLQRGPMELGMIRCNSEMDDDGGYWTKVLFDHTWLTCSDETIIDACGLEPYYRCPGQRFRHSPWIQRSNFGILVSSFSGLDI